MILIRDGSRYVRLREFRQDSRVSYRRVETSKKIDPHREERILQHQKRVQMELKNAG